MQQANIIINQVAVLMILVVIGCLAGKTGYLPKDTGTFLSKVIIRITAPSLIISTMTSYNFDAKTLADGLWVSFFAIAFMLFSLLAGMLFSRLLKLEGATANVFRAHSMLGNVGYMALPLFKAILGEKALVLAAFFVLSFEFLNWTLGVYLLNRHKRLSINNTLKNFINANTISCMLGLIFALTNLQHYINGNNMAGAVYNIFYSTFNPLGNCTLPLVMLFIGLSTAENPSGSFLAILKKPVTLMLSLLKLLLIPLAALAIMLLLGELVDPLVRTIVILDLAMPCATVIVALSAEYGSDHQLATDNVIYTTLLSLFTLPLFMLLLNYIK